MTRAPVHKVIAMRSILRLFLFALLVAGAACTQQRNGQPAPQPTTTVRVQNQAWLDVNIYVVRTGGSRQRLGSVTSASTAVFRIPDTAVGMGRDLRFLADPVGSRSVASSFNMFVRPGEQVTLTIPATLGR